jgi:hypothetical protein
VVVADVMYGPGRRVFWSLHVHDPSRNFMLEKSGFGGVGTGVLSIVGELPARATVVVAAAGRKAEPTARMAIAATIAASANAVRVVDKRIILLSVTG